MDNPQLRRKTYRSALIAGALAVVAFLLGEFYYIGLCAIYGTGLIFDFIKREPEIIEAEGVLKKAQWPLVIVFVAFVFIGSALERIENYAWVYIRIVQPGMLVFFAAMFLIWPGVIYYRAQNKVRERKQREAE